MQRHIDVRDKVANRHDAYKGKWNKPGKQTLDKRTINRHRIIRKVVNCRKKDVVKTGRIINPES